MRLPPRLLRSRRLVGLLAGATLLSGAMSSAAAQGGPPKGGGQGGGDGVHARSDRAPDVLVGMVVDAIGRPMADVEVQLASVNRGTRTDARGVWRLVDPPAGPHVVIARSIGYVPYVREVVIGSAANDTVTLLLRRYPRTLSPVEVNARANRTIAGAQLVADRLMQLGAGAGRLFTREQILEQRPYSIAELIQGVPGILVRRGRTDSERGQIIATTTRSGVGIMNTTPDGGPCQLQFYMDITPIDGEGVAQLDPMTFRSVEVYPSTVLLPGLPQRPDRCGAVVINTLGR